MKLRELIERLTTLELSAGPDRDVYIDTTPDGLLEIEEVDDNEESDGIVIWAV